MSLTIRVTDLATRIATECKSIRTLVNGNAADNAALTTTAKSNLVAAINEVKAIADAAAGGAGAISDTTSTDSTTWSSNKVTSHVAAQVALILGGASAAYDTLLEIQTALAGDDTDISGLLTAVGNRLRFDAAQTLTAPQLTQAQDNLQVYSRTQMGDPETVFVNTFNTGLL